MIRRRPSGRQRGFTLAEILVTTAIFAILMVAALSVYDKSNRVFKNATEAADMQQSTRIGFDKLVSDIRMAGFDYNRGGAPTGAGQYSQPDEQIEYAGVNVIAFRANFNYNTAVASCTPTTTTPCGNGLEPNLVPKDANGNKVFPLVTTSNDEIIIYALRSADSSKNTDSISFWADTATPRGAWPGSPQNGAEQKVTVSGIDTSGNNPPYTLYRITATEAGQSGITGTPVAENIRDLHFFYSTNTQGTSVLRQPNATADPITDQTDADGTTHPATLTINGATVYTGAIGGAGQYVIKGDGTVDTSVPHYLDRAVRGTISAVRLDLIGMNTNEDRSYTNPNETNAAFSHYREYQLSALIAPRNLGLTGFPEPSYTPPSPPTINSVCTGICAAPLICWTPPAGGGQTQAYAIEWDTTPPPLGAFNNLFLVTDPSLTQAIVPDTFAIDPSKTYYYRMVARNDNGDSQPSNAYSAQPKNATKPLPPSAMAPSTPTVTTASHAQNAANTDYAIGLGWIAPTKNDSSVASLTCIGAACGGVDPVVIQPQETIRFRVWRGTDANFAVPANKVSGNGVVKILDESVIQNSIAPGATVPFVDRPGSSLVAPAPCVAYYYRIQTIDRCAANATWNTSGNVSDAESTFFPSGTVPTFGKAYDAGTGVYANAPLNMTADTTVSACPGPGGTYCHIVLNWPAVTADTAGNTIGVDRYRITRYRKKVEDAKFTIDSTFGSNGVYDMSGQSQTAKSTVTFTDDTAVANDTDGTQWYYEYTTQANDCRLSPNTASADFPTPCAASPTIVQAGAANGKTASGMSPNDPWIFNTGDTITVSPPAGKKFVSVRFDVATYPGGVAVGSLGGTVTPAADGSATFQWKDTQASGQVYSVKITVDYGTCQEIHVRFVQQYTAAGCSFANQIPPANGSDLSFPSPGQAAQQPMIEAFTITNGGVDLMHIASQPINFAFTADANHTDLVLVSVQYAYPTSSFQSTDTFSGSPGSTISRTMPVNMPDIAVGKSFTITFTWNYKKTESKLTVSPLTKVCLGYFQWAQDPITLLYGVDPNDPLQKFCNLVGQAANTANPSKCD